MADSRIVTGARVFCYVNNAKLGVVVSFRYSASEAGRAIHGIDSLHPFELTPGPIRVTGQMTVIRRAGDGGFEGLGMTAQGRFASLQKYFSLALAERKTDAVLFRADYCKVLEQSWSVDAKGLMTGQVSFEGLTWFNDSGFAA